MRTTKCGNLKNIHIKKKIVLCGWVEKIRNLGKLIFLQLRDRYGISQIVFNTKFLKKFPEVAQIKLEFCMQIIGIVQKKKIIII